LGKKFKFLLAAKMEENEENVESLSGFLNLNQTCKTNLVKHCKTFWLNFIVSNKVSGKLLLTTRREEGSSKSEIIDLVNPLNRCQLMYPDYPFDKVGGSVGGLLNNNIPLICGGFRDIMYRKMNGKYLDDCFAIHPVAIQLKLSEPRAWGASIVLDGQTLWITGGVLNTSRTTKTTEYVGLDGTRPGPDLPLELQGHCLVAINATTLLLTGGITIEYYKSAATYFFSIEDQVWTAGPPLMIGRYVHSCAVFNLDNQMTVIVTGGYDSNYLSSSELLIIGSDAWTQGITKQTFKKYFSSLKYNLIWLQDQVYQK
jgi:hypothetical protein